MAKYDSTALLETGSAPVLNLSVDLACEVG